MRIVSVLLVSLALVASYCGPGLSDEGGKRLNSLVVELLNKDSVASGKAQEWSFTNPYDGWVFFSVTHNGKSGMVSATLDGGTRIISADVSKVDAAQEAMRFLSKGSHRIKVSCIGDASARKIIVRSVPELAYMQYGNHPHVTYYGLYDWDFLQKYVNPNMNAMVAPSNAVITDASRLKEWKNQGKRWLLICNVPYWEDTTVDVDKTYQYWHGNPGFHNKWVDGIIVDEFGGKSEDPKYLNWTEAVNRIYQDPKMKNRYFYPYTGHGMYEGSTSKVFAETVMNHGGVLAEEYYYAETTTDPQDALKAFQRMKNEVIGWQEVRPDANRHILFALGHMSQPTESLNRNPSVDFKVFLDLEMNFIANDPAFNGLYGLSHYLSSYADEETVRWASRLFRHYCIEGKKNMLSDELGYKYKLDHIDNPDFADGATGWKLSPAEEGSITTGSLEGWSSLQARYPKTKMGDTFLITKRSENGPNVVSQQIKNLKKGEWYSLKMYTANYADIRDGVSNKRTATVAIKIDNVEFMPGMNFDQQIDNCYSHHLGKFNDQHKAWLNYHYRVFKALGPTATLTISDWARDDWPLAPIDQETMYNFVEVQPYYAK